MVVNSCNFSYWRGIGRRIRVQGWPWSKKLETVSEK
jgi:hypothetical protein